MNSATGFVGPATALARSIGGSAHEGPRDASIARSSAHPRARAGFSASKFAGARVPPKRGSVTWELEPPAPPPAVFLPPSCSAAGPQGELAPPPAPARIPSGGPPAPKLREVLLMDESESGSDDEEDRGGQPLRRWSERYDELKAFVGEYGHARVPRLHGGLAHWCEWQRMRRDKGRLSSPKVALLDAVGFPWNLREATWEAFYADAAAVRKALKVERLTPAALTPAAIAALEAGGARARALAPRAGAVRAWIYRQRLQHRAGRLSPEQAAKLEQLGCLEVEEAEEGSSSGRRPGRPRKDDGPAARRAPAARLSQADTLWFDSEWEQFYDALRAMKAEHGHCNAHSARHGPVDEALAAWADRQRALRRRGALATALVRRLDDINFGWSLNEARWKESFSRLAAFREEHGHCSVPQRYPADPQLARLVSNLRAWRKSGLLAPERQCELDGIGFEWDKHADDFAASMKRLAEYKKRHGSANVLRPETPAATDDPDRPALSQFAYRMARQHRAGSLSPQKLKALEKVGLTDGFPHIRAHSRRPSWHEMYEEMKEWREKHGTCKVPRTKADLYAWAFTQQRRRALGALSPARADALDALGFEWGARASWDSRFAQLCAFVNENGHCRVPAGADEDAETRALAKWLSYNRSRRRTGDLPEEKVRALDSVGMVWEPRREKEEAAAAAREEARAAAAAAAAEKEAAEKEADHDVDAIEAALESASRELRLEKDVQRAAAAAAAPAAAAAAAGAPRRFQVPEFRPPFDDTSDLPASRLPFSFDEALWHAFKSVRAAARASFMRNSVEISLPQEEAGDKDPLLLATRELTFHLARESQAFAGPRIRGRTVKVFFSDAGSAALARREWGERLGELPYKICFFRTGGIGDAVTRDDEAVIVVAPYPPEFENVVRIATQAQALVRPFILLNQNLAKWPNGQRPPGTQARQTAAFLNSLQTSYCLRHYHSGVLVFRSFPSNWQVVAVNERAPDDYTVVKEMVNRPTRVDIDLALQDLLGTERFATLQAEAGQEGLDAGGPGGRSAWSRFADFVSRVTGLDVFQ